MKNFVAILICCLVLSACGNDSPEAVRAIEQQSEKDSIPTLYGEFIFLSGAAVLKGDDFIYGVNIDSISLELAEKVKEFKKEDFDMVPVVVKAKIMQNPRRDGWDEIIDILEIVDIPKQQNTDLEFNQQ